MLAPFFHKLLFNCVVYAFCFSEGRICRKIGLGISFFDATEEGGHSLSTEKFANQLWRWFQVRRVKFFGLHNSLWGVSARASCKFVLPKEMSPFFLLAGETIIQKHISTNPVYGTNIKAPEFAVKGAPGRKCV